jgi:hypothetical protein
LRLNYDPATDRWTLDPGYPTVTIAATAPVEAVVIDKDSTGRLWITYTQNTAGGNSRAVYVAHTGGAPGDAWNAPYQLPVGHAADLTPDDISSVVAYGKSIGVMWSNQTTQTVYFAAHADGTGDAAANWTRSTALSGRFAADDHINMKSIQGDTQGRVFAVVKTGIGDSSIGSPFDAQIVLLQRTSTGAWKSYPVGTVRDDHTRPIVLTDQRTRRLYVFATSPTVADAGVQTIYYKVTSLDAPSFTTGLGTRFMRSSSGFDINDASSTKQDLGSLPYLLVLGSDATNYWHNTLSLGHTSFAAAPVITGLSASPRAFRVAGKRVRPTRRLGTTVSFELNEPAVVRLRVDGTRPGRRVGRRCVRSTAANRGRRACIRYVKVASDWARVAGEGRNRITFSGRFRHRALASGRHLLVVSARDAAGLAAVPAVARFRILPAR